jgi:hypothetical protein
MTLSFKEKNDLAINLLEQGISSREIAKQTHLSYSTIGKIRKEHEGDTIEKSNKPISISSQAFKLFEKHKTLVQVAIELDLPSEEVLQIRSQYLTLQNNQKVESILRDNKNNLNIYLGIYLFDNNNDTNTELCLFILLKNRLIFSNEAQKQHILAIKIPMIIAIINKGKEAC